MSINLHNHISMVSSFVGMPQGGIKQVNKDQAKAEQPLNQPNVAEDGDSSEDDSGYFKTSAKKSAGGAAHARHAASAKGKQSADAVQRRVVSEEQVKDTDGSKATEGAAKSGKAPTTAKSGKSPLLYDTSRFIQHNFQETAAAQQQPAKLRPDIQRKQFAENLRKWVQLEYSQFTKNADPLYTRRNLREILNALGDSDSKTNKYSSKEDSVGKNKIGFSKFNKYNITQASQALKLFEEINSPESEMQNLSELDLVA